MTTTASLKKITPSFIKYLLAIIYDLFLLLGVLLFLTVIFSFFNHGEPPKSSNIFYRLSLLITIIFFYHYSWHKSGQTLGMKSWKLKLISQNNKPITLKQSIIRIILGITNIFLLGLGFFWKYTNSSRLTLMDYFSKTQLIITK